jgi:hypothetical protein
MAKNADGTQRPPLEWWQIIIIPILAALIPAGIGAWVAISQASSSATDAIKQYEEKQKDDNNTHADDLETAIHTALPDLLAADAGRVRAAFASVYFFGVGEQEKAQIVLTIGAARTPQIRDAISNVILIDNADGASVAKDPRVQAVIKPLPPVGPTPRPSIVDTQTKSTVNDALDFAVPVVNGTGWVYLGVSAARTPIELRPSAKSRTIEEKGVLEPGFRITFHEAVNFRSAEPSHGTLGPKIGSLRPNEAAIIEALQPFDYNGKFAVWAKVYLCDAAASAAATAPLSAKTACPHVDTSKPAGKLTL